jgi:ATP-dependent helicase/nuclease subunit B
LQPPSATIFTSPRAQARLGRATDWLLAGGKDRPTVVVGATSGAARALVRQATATSGASIGWRPTTLAGLALWLASGRLLEDSVATAGAVIVEGLTVRALHHLREAGGLGRLVAIADRPGLPRALAQTVLELRTAGIDPRALEADVPELGRLLAAFSALLESEKLADRAAILQLAAEQCRRAPPQAAVLLLDVPVWSRVEADFIAALVPGARALLATIPLGDDRSAERLRRALPEATWEKTTDAPSTSLGRLQEALFVENSAAPAARGDDVVFMSAPGESRECVEIARRLLREAEAGTPFDRMAILLRTPGPYRPHLEEALRRARIPAHFSSGAVQPDPSGRAFLALLRCLEEGLSASRFAEYLSLGETPPTVADDQPRPAPPVADRWVPPEEELFPSASGLGNGEDADADIGDESEPTGLANRDTAEGAEKAPAAGTSVIAGTLRAPPRWEQILLDAAVIGGRDRWARRLDGRKAELELRLATLEPDDPVEDLLRRELAELAALRAFALPILEDLAALPADARWGDWLDGLSALATRTLRRPERVLSVLAELTPIAPVGPVGLREVLVVLARRLANLVLPVSPRTAGRVFIGPIAAGRGLAFDVVFVPGLAERVFPQRVVQDPFLRDDLRARLGSELSTSVERIEAERLALRIAVGSACQKVVLSYSRVDAEQARPRVPSFYGLEVVRAVEGSLPTFEVLARNADRGSASRLGWPAPDDPSEAIDEAEHDLAWLGRLMTRTSAPAVGAARYLITSNQHLARSLRHRAMRFRPNSWSYADGLVKPDEAARQALAAHGLAKRSFSPTAMQTFAACPYRFFLHAVHKLAPRDEPVAIERMDPLERGSLVHATLFALLSELRDRGLVPVRPDNFEAARAALDRLLTREAAQFKDRLAPAVDQVWEDEMSSIRADLLEALRRDAERPPWSPRHLELAFGLPASADRDPASRPEPVALDCGISLRGSIDVVEESATGTLRATDHKTGKARRQQGALVSGGEVLQPVFYALAIEKLFPDRQVDSGRLSYCTSAGEFKEVIVPLDADARAAATQVAAAIDHGLTSGFLPAAPGKDACRYCDYRPICGPWEEERFRKKTQRGELSLLEKVRRLP